jgi:hypothetical protein
MLDAADEAISVVRHHSQRNVAAVGLPLHRDATLIQIPLRCDPVEERADVSSRRSALSRFR